MLKHRRFRPRIDLLEGRQLLTGPAAIGPADVREIYGFSSTFNINGRVTAADGRDQTIAIIAAYYDPTIQGDLNAFDSHFGLPSATVNVQFVRPNTLSTAYDTTRGWGAETALDVEYAHAIAPAANIVLVEAKSAATDDLLDAVNFARSYPKVSVVSMSFGFAEGANQVSNERTLDSQLFTTPSGHTPITFVAATGDNGSIYNRSNTLGGPAYPSTSPNVLAVGGTSFVYNAYGNVVSETGWSGSGGGKSSQEPEPSFQRGVQSTGTRTVPDVSYLAASPSVIIYNTAPRSLLTGLITETGTSAGAPQWAGLIAVADEGRGLIGKAPLDGATQTLGAIYTFTHDYHDVLTGNNGLYNAGTGYDLVTGLGSPVPGLLIPDLMYNVSSASGAGHGSVLPFAPPEAPGAAAYGVAIPLTVSTGTDANFAQGFPSEAGFGSPTTPSGTRPKAGHEAHDLALASLSN